MSKKFIIVNQMNSPKVALYINDLHKICLFRSINYVKNAQTYWIKSSH